MSNEVKKLQLVNPSKLNQLLDLLSSVYKCQNFKEGFTEPELSNVICAHNKLIGSRKNKE